MTAPRKKNGHRLMTGPTVIKPDWIGAALFLFFIVCAYSFVNN